MLILLISACSEIPPQAYYNAGDPEIQLDYKNEKISLPITDSRSVKELRSMLSKERPTYAEFACFARSPVCRDAERALKDAGVEIRNSASGSGVSLIYKKVVARDCDQSFLTNHVNPYNLNHQAYGCSIRGNMLQMVSDREQFTNPKMMGNSSGEKAVQAMDNYRKVPKSQDFIQSYSSTFSSN